MKATILLATNRPEDAGTRVTGTLHDIHGFAVVIHRDPWCRKNSWTATEATTGRYVGSGGFATQKEALTTVARMLDSPNAAMAIDRQTCLNPEFRKTKEVSFAEFAPPGSPIAGAIAAANAVRP